MKIKAVLALLFIFAEFIESKELAPLFKNFTPSNLPELKMAKALEYLKNLPTGIDPLGEGEGLDPGPKFSTKVFDCTTYVETILAIGLSRNSNDVPELLSEIRYQGKEVNYFQRNHFIVTDWIPSNTKKGFVSEITNDLATDPKAFRTDKRVLKKTIWLYHRAIDLLDQQKKQPKEILDFLMRIPEIKAQEDKATYLLASYFRKNVKAIQEKLPEVSIVMLIRNMPSIPTLVSHMGFIVKKNGQLYIHHAPQAKPWKVQEEPLEDYFLGMDAHRAPVEGLLILKLGERGLSSTSK